MIDLYSVHGKDVLLKAIDECAGATGNKLRYLVKILSNLGKPKKEEDDGKYMPVEEQERILASVY